MNSLAVHHPPRLSYCGLTIVLENPSRFDTRELLTGTAGSWFLGELKAASAGRVLRFHCDIRTSNVTAPLLDGTRVVLCLGEVAQHEWMGKEHSLKEQRGSPVVKNGIVYVSSFTPQDAHDFMPHEQRLNTQFRGAKDFDAESDDDEAKSHKGATRRGNYKFWLGRDVYKSLRILQSGISRGEQPDVRLHSTAGQLVSVLQSTAGGTLYLDIETTLERTLTCVGFGFDTGPIFVFPIRRYNFTKGYEGSELPQIFAALGGAMARNLCVTHNGHGFDWLVLAHHYRVPFGRMLYDTMIAHNRCYPEAEKSLGHCLSLWTDEPYHKDEGVFETHTREQEEQLWRYNAKDVHALRLLKTAFDNECKSDTGLAASIAQGNDMIYPYMVAALRGIKCDVARLEALVSVNDRYLSQLIRIAKILIGPENYAALQGKRDAGFLSSSDQAARYFYQEMGYKCPHKTDTGEDSCDSKAMLKLGIALAKKGVNNPLVALRLAFAGVRKETSMLANLNLWDEKSYVTSTPNSNP